MEHTSKALAPLVAALIALTLITGCGGSPATTPETPATTPTEQPAETPAEAPAEAPATDQDGDAEFVQTKCTMCHTYDRVAAAEKDKAGWTDTVTRMQQNGLVITDEEKTRIVEFLAK